ncbi:MAG: glycosyltransferase WbuB [Desulfuromonadales bacterium]|nr:MAG: glycosyltransferase WbuB [Desulfuromonadales bacterium]
MHVLFLTHYFPPEVNAPASRTYENARRWVRDGHRVTVITCTPNHPNGVVYPGYRNRWCFQEELDGIRVLRVKTYLSANKGFAKRIANYISYMISATLFSTLVRDVDVVVSTSPQFFCGLAGYFASRMRRAPWVVEIRDLWPESIIAVGAIRSRAVIDLLEGLETFMYSRADHVVAVTDAFKRHIAGRGVGVEHITVIKNGADLERFTPGPKENAFRKEYGLEGKFVVSYVGTHGMAHGLDTIFEAAEAMRDREDIVFLLVGDGAERERLLTRKEEQGLSNVLMIPQQPKERMPEIINASDACMVLLKKNDLFKTVIPSKIFEAMAMERPIILGVEGESREIVEQGRCGLCIEPENAVELAEAIRRLDADERLAGDLGQNGRCYVSTVFDREVLARRYLETLSPLVPSQVATMEIVEKESM